MIIWYNYIQIVLYTSNATICYLYQGWTQSGCVRGGGRGAESRSFELIGARHEWGKSMRAGVGPPPEKMKILEMKINTLASYRSAR